MIRSIVSIIAAGALATLSARAQATLGADVASIEANQQRLAATRDVKSLATGELHELKLPSGSVVRQYVSPAGVVYAVSWRGHGMPDLRELLGTYFTQLSAPSHRRGGHHRMGMTGSDFVMESSGHNRRFVGRAWVPSLVPAGVDAAAVVEPAR